MLCDAVRQLCAAILGWSGLISWSTGPFLMGELCSVGLSLLPEKLCKNLGFSQSLPNSYCLQHCDLAQKWCATATRQVTHHLAHDCRA